MKNPSYGNNPKLDGLIFHRFGKMDDQICNSEKQFNLDSENSVEKNSEKDEYDWHIVHHHGWHIMDHHCD